ncbi:hypothetical protein GOP47_0027579, partial [Adiantum capillus-veneris]
FAKMKPKAPMSNSRTSFARLKHALESLEGREKYWANTNSPSDGDDVRWYFSKSPLSLEAVAASTPLSEVVGKSDFLRFSVNDSLSLEAAFLKEEEELVSAWWKEYAECSEGPLGASAKGKEISSEKDKDSEYSSNGIHETSKHLNDANLYESDEIIGVSVKGGLYEVDLYRRRCFPVYWTGDHRRVLRGHWFAQKGGLDWLPLREDVSEQLEFAYRSQIWHRRTFQPSGKFAARVNLQSPIEGLHALFTGEDDTWEAWLGVDLSGISSVLGFRGNGFKLRRGFAPSQSPQPTQDELRQRKEEEMDDYCSQVPVGHLVFMVHGIGQRLEKANLIDDVGTFRHTTTLLAEQHLTSHQRNSLRVLFIPCQWRRGLKLAGEEAVENCTLEGVRALRTMLSATVHDVLYYMSPVYCQDIIDSVSGQLNMLYLKFIKRNPGYDGKVSVYGHSLGSVLSFDILCHQRKLTSSFPMSQLHETSQKFDALDLQNLRSKENGDFIESEELSTKNHTSQDYANIQESHELDASNTPIDRLRNEIAKLKAKIASLEEAHNASKQQVGGMDEYLLKSGRQEQNFEQPSSGSTSENKESEWLEEKKSGAVELEESSDNRRLASPASTRPSSQKRYLKPRSSSRKRYTPYIEYTKLAFEVDTFFAVGSPLGVFLSLRNIRLGIGNGKGYWEDDGIEEEMPACKRLFNVFHPFDPVAYRIEPLVCKEYMHNQPVFLPYHRGGRRLHIGVQEFGKEMSARSMAFVHSITAAGDRVAKVFSSTSEKMEEHVQEPKERTYGSFMIEKLTGEPNGRIDFMLQDATFEHQYLQAISSHTAYWQDADTALFILKHLYRDIPDESPDYKAETAAIEESNDVVEATLEPTTVLNESKVADDELAFTFSRSDSLVSTKSNSGMRLSQEQS